MAARLASIAATASAAELSVLSRESFQVLVNRVCDHWGAAIGLAGLALTLAALRGTVIDPKFPAPMYVALVYLSIAIALVVTLCGVGKVCLKYSVRDVTENFRSAKRKELEELLPLYDELVGGDRPSLNQLKDLHNANQNCFIFMESATRRDSGTTRQIVGFCTVIPVNSEAQSLLERDELNGLKFNRTHISPAGSKSKAVYIGSIGARGPAARASILTYVLGKLDDCASHGVTKVFTRPITNDGLRIARKYGFEPVSQDVRPDDLFRLYHLDLPRDGEVRVRRKSKPRPLRTQAAVGVATA